MSEPTDAVREIHEVTIRLTNAINGRYDRKDTIIRAFALRDCALSESKEKERLRLRCVDMGQAAMSERDNAEKLEQENARLKAEVVTLQQEIIKVATAVRHGNEPHHRTGDCGVGCEVLGPQSDRTPRGEV